MRLILVLFMAALLTGCAFSREAVPTADVRFAEADYELGENTEAEVCRSYLFAISWGRLFGSDTAVHSEGNGFFGGIFGGMSSEAEEAMYLALEKKEGATHLLAPRVKTTFTGFGTTGIPLFGSRCGLVRAKTVTIGGPRYSGIKSTASGEPHMDNHTAPSVKAKAKSHRSVESQADSPKPARLEESIPVKKVLPSIDDGEVLKP